MDIATVTIPRDLLIRTIDILREHWFVVDEDGEESNDDECIEVTHQLEKYK